METIVFSGSYKSLSKIADFVIKAAKDAGLNDKATYEVELAVDEACCNIIDHAYGGEGNGDVECSIDVSEGELTIILRDDGQPFDPDSVPDPQLNIPLEKLKSRGVGLYLMYKIMDEIDYTTSKEDGNELKMVKRNKQ